MGQAINDLVSMRDVEGLLEIMNDSDDWMDQVDAAEGLVKLGDRRGLQYLRFTLESDDEQVRQVVQEILASPEVKRMREQIEIDQRLAYQKGLEKARQRLKKGASVFLHKMMFLPSGDVLQEDLSGDGFHIAALDEAGLEGWEVVSVLPRRRRILAESVDEQLDGAYVLLKKRLGPEDAAELEG
jgi:hypothetical protein